MTRQAVNRWWRQCAGCGRERRFAQSGTAMCDHNRWDPAVKAMVRCEGRPGTPPHSAPASAGEHSHASGVPGLVRGAV
jgi:hypothetical protein